MDKINLPADLPENLEWNQVIAPHGADIGKPEQYGYNYLMKQVNAAQRAYNALSQITANLTSEQIAYLNSSMVDVTNLKEAVDSLSANKANINSPLFTGQPEAPIPAATSNDTQIATTAFVRMAVDSAISSSTRLKITFTPSFAGSVFSISATDFSYSGIVPDDLVVMVAVPALNTVYTITCDGITGYVTVGGYFGIYSTPFPTTLNDFTWAQIAEISAAGLISTYFQIGDEKTDVFTTGEAFTAQYYGSNHDNLADGSGKAGITFGLKHLMAGTRHVNSENTNVGGITSTPMYSWLSNTQFYQLPPDLQAVIKPVNKKTSAGNQSTTIKTNSMKNFLFSEVEVFGTVSRSAVGEGEKYPIFTDNNSRIKLLSNGTGNVETWQLRSPDVYNTTQFCAVIATGGALSNVASIQRGICFGFCI